MGDPMTEINRRQFVIAAGALCAGLTGCTSSNNGTGETWTGPTRFDLGPAAQFKDGVDARWAQSGGFFLVREAGRLYAVTSTCSHRACALAAKGSEYVCPCHGSHFTPQGRVTIGPATTSLVRFAISLDPAGHLIVDRTRTFDEPHWTDPAASVPT
jgi:cytochrome b6-f complex iron-sulfur subunit